MSCIRAESMHKSMHECIKATKHKGFIGKGTKLGLKEVTLLKYKGRANKARSLGCSYRVLREDLNVKSVEIEEADEIVVQGVTKAC